MLKSTKGNLLCFQWEVERFQRRHREKMAAVAPQTSNKPISLPRHRGGPCKTAKVDGKRQNANDALLVEKTSRAHGAAGGRQRRSLQESQDGKTALQFGKASEALSRAANKRRLNLRKKKQERVRRENAKLFTRLASPNRSGIDFNKFEAEFSKSRARHRMIHCDRTVGHTLVFSAVHAREPCPGAEATTAVCGRTRRRKQPPPRRKELSEAAETNAAAWARVNCAPQDQSVHAHRLLSTRRPLSAWLSPRPPPGDLGMIQGVDSNGDCCDEAHNNNNALVADNKDGEAKSTACRAQTASRCRQGSGANRPHTALGLRGGRDHPTDLFDARAADPGWGSTGVYSAVRPLSAPERDLWRGWAQGRAKTSCGRQATPPQTLPGKGARTYRPRSATTNERGKRYGAHNGGNVSEDGSEYSGNRECFFGRTLLAEAKLLVDGSAQTNLRCRTKVSLKCSSLDGLMRQQGRVRKTLQGFVVEASIAAARPHNGTGEGADRVCSSSVAVSVVQDFLETSARNLAEASLAPFMDAPPLDDRGNYPELNALMGKAGQRDLYQTLLGSCRVVTAVDGAIGVEFLQGNTGLGMSATVATPGAVGEHRARAHRATFPRPRRPVAAKHGESLPTGTKDKVRRAGAAHGGGGGGSGQRHSGPKECHAELAGTDDVDSNVSFFASSSEEQEVEEPPGVAAQSPSAAHTARQAAVESSSEGEIYETLSVEDVEEEEEEKEEEEKEEEEEHESDYS